MKIILQHLAAFIMLFSLPAAGFMFLLLLSSSAKQENNNAAATAQSNAGYLIFFCSKPVTPYDTLGEVKNKFSISGSPAELFEQLLKKVKKDFPKADAIIFAGYEMEKATAIKFK